MPVSVSWQSPDLCAQIRCQWAWAGSHLICVPRSDVSEHELAVTWSYAIRSPDQIAVSAWYKLSADLMTWQQYLIPQVVISRVCWTLTSNYHLIVTTTTHTVLCTNSDSDATAICTNSGAAAGRTDSDATSVYTNIHTVSDTAVYTNSVIIICTNSATTGCTDCDTNVVPTLILPFVLTLTPSFVSTLTQLFLLTLSVMLSVWPFLLTL